jgi:hypothetical protein
MEVYPGLRKFAYLIYAFSGVVKMEDWGWRVATVDVFRQWTGNMGGDSRG